MSGEDKNKDKYNQSIEDVLGGDTEDTNYDYEDDYVYGDSEDVDYSKLGYSTREDEDDTEEGTDYSNPKQEVKVKGKYDYLLEDEEDNKPEEEPKLTLQEKVSNGVNKTLDFIEGKRFNTIQWVVALGFIIGLGVIIVMLVQAGSNLVTNVDHQEQAGAKYTAKEVAPEEYETQEMKQDELDKQKEELENYIDKKSSTYKQQTEELGEVPEGYTAVQDIDGNVKYVSPEEYDELINNEVRTNTTADTTGNDEADITGMEVEIIPSKKDIWYEITSTPIKDINEDAIYQSRGQFIYFVQKALKIMYAQPLLGAEFDTDTYTMKVILNPDATYKLPDDFEERMKLAYKNSGYQTQAPDELNFEYEDGDINDYLN